MNSIFSIIIPCYNISKVVDQALKSCLSQKGISSDEFEIIAINDGSTDDTYTRLLKYSIYPNVTILNQPNSGLSRTRNHGIKLSKGKYILFLDGDDWLSENALASLLPHLGSADLILFPMVYYYGSERTINNSLGLVSGKIYTASELLKNTIGKSQFQSCPAPAKCYKRSLFIDHNLHFIDGILHEDGPFYLDTISHCKTVKYLGKFIYYYRQQRPGSITTVKRTWRNAEGIIKGMRHVFEIYGYSNKDINYYYLSTSEMQGFQKYQSKEDYRKVINHFSKFETRKFLFRALINFRFNVRTFMLGFLIVFLPKLSGYLYATKHKLY